MNKRTEKLIANYFDSQISEQESEELIAWIEKGNIDVFNEYVLLNFSIEQIKIAKENSEALAWDKIASKINSNSPKVIPFYKKSLFRYAVAASVALLITITLVLRENGDSQIETIIVNNNIEIGKDRAILTLEDGSRVELEKGNRFKLDNISSNGEEIIYKKANKVAEAKEPIYNYLTIPRGGQFKMNLSDGTVVWLNSESQIKFPKEFIPNQDRKVELLYGEAYFYVSPSVVHNGAIFKVVTQSQEIKVLGTEFNIKAYKDEDLIYTTLVEGKVGVSINNNFEVLKPNEQSILNKKNNDLVISEVDTISEIAWKRGFFSFKDKTLKEIARVLSRWYDVDIIFVDKELENVRFKGVLSRNQNIEEILILIKNTNFINTYEINNKTILIKN